MPSSTAVNPSASRKLPTKSRQQPVKSMPPLRQPTDETEQARLIALAKGGDARAFGRLVEQFLPMMYAYARALCGDHHAAEDAVQESAVIAFRKLEHFFDESDFGTWLRAITRRKALEARRRLRRPTLLVEEVIEAYYSRPERPAENTARLEALRGCLEEAPDRLRRTVRAHYFEGMRLDRIAAQQETTEAAVKQFLYRARRLLADCVRRRLEVSEEAS